MKEVVPSRSQQQIIRASDACVSGMGGIFFLNQGTFQAPMLWQASFPPSTKASLITQGTITNSDLELAATLAHHNVIAHATPVQKASIRTLLDNIATVAWQKKGSTSTASATAYILCLQALHQCHHKYVATTEYIPGMANVTADNCL